MCGIVGILGDIGPKQENLFRDLWLVDVLRGDDSSGIAFINGNNHVRVVKDIGTPHDIMHTKSFQKGASKQSIGLIGHNRAATVGQITREMAHPFQFKNIVGVHNGTLRSRYSLPDYKDFESDSENIFYAINKNGIKTTWPQVRGAAALVWWDKKAKTLNLLRNEERPLLFTFFKSSEKDGEDCGSFMAFASEFWMIEQMFSRQRIKHGTIWRPKAHIQFIFRYNQKKKEVTYTTEDREKIVWLEKFIPKLPFTPIKSNNVVNKLGFGNKSMSLWEFRKTYTNCAFCDGKMYQEYLNSVIIDEHTAVCSSCASRGDQAGLSSKLMT